MLQDHWTKGFEAFHSQTLFTHVMPEINCYTINQATVLCKTFLSVFIDIHRA